MGSCGDDESARQSGVTQRMRSCTHPKSASDLTMCPGPSTPTFQCLQTGRPTGMGPGAIQPADSLREAAPLWEACFLGVLLQRTVLGPPQPLWGSTFPRGLPGGASVTVWEPCLEAETFTKVPLSRST